MQQLPIYAEKFGCQNGDEVFSYFMKTLKPSITLWSYFVNWEKVLENAKQVEIALNTLNYLIGKDDFDTEFVNLLKNNPSVAAAIPALIVRDGDATKKFKILVDYSGRKLVYEDYDFGKTSPTDEDIRNYLHFVESTGLKALLVSKRIKNLVDYVIGVEAGLDSNGRKNRGGTSMEIITEQFIAHACNNKGYRYVKQANAALIKEVFGYAVPFDKSSRRYDFVIDDGEHPILVETNFYGGGGSKLKATAGEYRSLHAYLAGRCKFVWITDGKGWESTEKPLRETYDQTEYVFNLNMLENGVLESII